MAMKSNTHHHHRHLLLSSLFIIMMITGPLRLLSSGTIRGYRHMVAAAAYTTTTAPTTRPRTTSLDSKCYDRHQPSLSFIHRRRRDDRGAVPSSSSSSSLLLSLSSACRFSSSRTTTSSLSSSTMDQTTSSVSATTSDTNPNVWFHTEGLPKFTKLDPKQLTPTITTVVNQLSEQFHHFEQEISSSSSDAMSLDDMISKLEHMTYPMTYIWGVAGHLNRVMNTPELRTAYEENQEKIVTISNEISQSKALYDAFSQMDDVVASSSSSFDEKQRYRAVTQSLKNMKLGGVNLEGTAKERYNEIQMKLATLSNTFSNNILDETKEYGYTITDPTIMTNVPETAKAMWSTNYINHMKSLAASSPDGEGMEPEQHGVDDGVNQGPWRITLASPSYIAAMSHIPDRNIREEIYKASIHRASEFSKSETRNNIPLIYEILSVRQEMAQLLGYNNYAEVSLATKMASSVDAVQELSNLIIQKALPSAEKELAEITTYARQHGEPDDYSLEKLPKLMPWDITYWSERYKESKFQLTEEETRPYFALKDVLQGMFTLVSRIFHIDCQEVTMTDDNNVDVWHPDVKFFHVRDRTTQRLMASFYLDPYSRPENKLGGAWMDTCIGKSAALQHDVPVAYMVCNSSPPTGTKPSLMTFHEVETLFHEFGHALQHMLTIATISDVAGINGIEWDAVELPSQFMENWCYDYDTVYGFAKHWETGEPMPLEMFEKLKLQKTYNAGMIACRQLLFGQLDLELHANYHNNNANNNETIFDVHQRMARIYTPYNTPLPDDRFLCTFSHIFSGGYAAGYYSYKWAEVMSSDAFAAFEEVGLTNHDKVQEVGMKFRNTILSYGGGIDPMSVYQEFRGRGPNPDALLRHTGLDK